MMKYIFMIAPFAAIWLQSANEQGIIGNWGYWTSLLLWLMFGAGVYMTDKEKGSGENAK